MDVQKPVCIAVGPKYRQVEREGVHQGPPRSDGLRADVLVIQSITGQGAGAPRFVGDLDRSLDLRQIRLRRRIDLRRQNAVGFDAPQRLISAGMI